MFSKILDIVKIIVLHQYLTKLFFMCIIYKNLNVYLTTKKG